ncbi:hypothetical protein BDN72DRAFT_851356, partial [Pluteus cervinus]
TQRTVQKRSDGLDAPQPDRTGPFLQSNPFELHVDAGIDGLDDIHHEDALDVPMNLDGDASNRADVIIDGEQVDGMAPHIEEEGLDDDNGDGGDDEEEPAAEEPDPHHDDRPASPSPPSSSNSVPLEAVRSWGEDLPGEDDDVPLVFPSEMPNVTINYDDLPQAKIPKLKLSQDMIKCIRNANLEDDIKDKEVLRRLRKPQEDPPAMDDTMKFSIRMFNAQAGGSIDQYNRVRNVLATHPTTPVTVHSHHVVKKAIEEQTNIPMIRTDMCPKTCHAFAGPFEGLNACAKCQSPRYDPLKPGKKQPLKQFYTFPLGPMLQALVRTSEGAKRMRYRWELTQELLQKLESGGGVVQEFEDFFHGSDYLNMVIDEEIPITEDDIFVQLSIDGAQLYRDKESDC